MKKIAIIAPTGMLGSAVYGALHEANEVILIVRNRESLIKLEERYGGTDKCAVLEFDLMNFYQEYLEGFREVGQTTAQFLQATADIDGIINCAGIIKPYSTNDPQATLFINAIIPHVLSRYFGSRLIHITTDCVYDGLSGAPYDENSHFSPNDLYGLSKLAGEPAKNSLVLRTSIVGNEISGFVSLVEWFKKQAGKKINGFTNHYWNGITTKQFGIVCHKIINNREQYPKNGLFHIFSNDVSKYQMLLEFKEKFNIDCEILPIEHSPIDRRLATVYDLCKSLEIPSFKEMVLGM